MKTIQRIHQNLPTCRELVRLGSSLLLVVGQRVPFLKPCAALFLENGAARGFLQLAVPVGVTYVGTHSLSGASVAVTTAGPSTNPATAQVGTDFAWFCQHQGSHEIKSYSVSGLPPGLVFTFGKPVSSITGKPTIAGSYIVSLTGWEEDGQRGESTAVYRLNLNVTGGITGPEIVVEQPLGSSLVDRTAKKGFGTVVRGRTKVKTFVIRNTGTQVLYNLSVAKSGIHSADFVIGTIGATAIAPGGQTTFKVTFKPSAIGIRRAAILIKSNDADENPFNIALTGTGA